MLKDLTYSNLEPDQMFAMIARINGHDISNPDKYFERYAEGIYRHDGYAFNGDGFISNNCVEQLVENYPFGFSSYGVCDNYSQIIEQYKDKLNDPNKKFCIILSTVRKADQPEYGGWRWHKWGEYIGTKNPQCEYLYDEDDDIELVYCYHIYEIT